MFLIIYVDDLKLAGKKTNFKEAWRRITDGGIKLDEPTPVDHFLGCRHIKKEITRKDGSKVTTMEWDFEDSLRNSVARYKDLAKGCGIEVKLKERNTPYRCEAIHQHRAPPCGGPCTVCPWCQTPSPPEQFRQYDSVEVLDAELRKEKRKLLRSWRR